VEAGIPLGVTFSFLIAAPMINAVAVVLLYGMFGWKVAALYTGTGLLIAIAAGMVIGRLHMEHLIEDWVREARITGGGSESAGLSWAGRVRYGLLSVREIVGKVWPYVLLGIAVGAGIHGYVPEGLMAGIMGAVALQYDQSAFGRPHYRGALEAAPWVVGLLQENWSQFGGVSGQVETLTKNLSGLSDRLSSLSAVARPPADLRLLHVSDLHNNPVGLQFVSEAVKSFKVDAVIDTGDLTDFGTPLEGELFGEIAELGVPYFFTPGNHDTPDLVGLLRRYRNITVLDGQTVTFRGLTILGAAAPASTRTSAGVASAGEFEAVDRALLGKVEAATEPPDVVAVHNRKMAESLVGRVGVILHGHDHRLVITSEQGTAMIDAGSTGASGVRGLQVKGGEDPYSMALLYFSRTSGGYRLQAVDTLEVRGKDAGFTLNRILVGTEEKTAAAANAD
jgi:predicted phosphodiesterase